MRAISERDLAVVIPLLAAKIRDLTLELYTSKGEPADASVTDHMQLQDMLGQYESILQSLREEYEEGLRDGIRLPAFDDLVRPFRLPSP